MENLEDAENRQNSFRKLEERKRILEIKISEKCYELKKLCIAEAELTGIIPMEIPLEPDESPPKIKRRIGTMFPFSEDVLHQLQAPCMPSAGKSPKRKIPLCPWNKGSETLPPKTTEPIALSPRQHATWGSKRASPSSSKQSSQRSQVYKAKINILKKW